MVENQQVSQSQNRLSSPKLVSVICSKRLLAIYGRWKNWAFVLRHTTCSLIWRETLLIMLFIQQYYIVD